MGVRTGRPGVIKESFRLEKYCQSSIYMKTVPWTRKGSWMQLCFKILHQSLNANALLYFSPILFGAHLFWHFPRCKKKFAFFEIIIYRGMTYLDLKTLSPYLKKFSTPQRLMLRKWTYWTITDMRQYNYYGVLDAGYGMRDTGCVIRDAGKEGIQAYTL